MTNHLDRRNSTATKDDEARAAPSKARPDRDGGPVLSRAIVQRATHLRDNDEQLAALWADARTRVLRIDKGLAPTVGDAGALALLSPAAIESVAPGSEGCYFLGIADDGVAYFAVHAPYAAREGESLATLRAVGGSLNSQDCGLFAHAAALGAWHDRAKYCPACGGATTPGAGGHLRKCEVCGASQFPRTDPAVICLVLDRRGRALLARNAAWPEYRYSTIAGFVEPGEAPEAAIAREVWEETGLRVSQINYQAAQPWPFPGSLMLAFLARASDSNLCLDTSELAEARWYSRSQLRAAVTTGLVRLPSSVSVARWQIENWLAHPLEGNQDW